MSWRRTEADKGTEGGRGGRHGAILGQVVGEWG